MIMNKLNLLLFISLINLVCVFSQLCLNGEFSVDVEQNEYSFEGDEIIFGQGTVYLKTDGLFYRVDFATAVPPNLANITVIENYQSGVGYFVDYVRSTCAEYLVSEPDRLCTVGNKTGEEYYIGSSTLVEIWAGQDGSTYIETDAGIGSGILLREFSVDVDPANNPARVQTDIYVNWENTVLDLDLFAPPADLCPELKSRNSEKVFKEDMKLPHLPFSQFFKKH